MQNRSFPDQEKLLESKLSGVLKRLKQKEKNKVLIVDDERSIRITLKNYFRAKGYSVETAIDGEDALENFIHSPSDLIITDLNMPRIDGLSLARKIKDISSETLVIVLTADNRLNSLQKSDRENIDYYLIKPFSLHDLETAVQLMLAKRKSMMNKLTS